MLLYNIYIYIKSRCSFGISYNILSPFDIVCINGKRKYIVFVYSTFQRILIIKITFIMQMGHLYIILQVYISYFR